MFDRFRRKPAENADPGNTPAPEPQPTSTAAARNEPAGEPTEPATYEIEAAEDDNDYSFTVSFYEEGLAWEEDERIDKLAELLDGRPEIKQAFREDREFILVDAPGMKLATFEALVAKAWDEAAVGTQYRQFDDAGELVDAERPNR